MRRLAVLDRGWALCLAVLLTCLIRTPAVLPYGRLWAEEGSDFVRDLAGASLPEALAYSFRGSLFLLISLPVWIGQHFPIGWLPTITTATALAAQMVLALLFGRWAAASDLPPGIAALVWFTFLLLPVNYEISASLTNVQWVCSLTCLVLALTPKEALPARWLLVPWVLACGLTGVPSCMFVPAMLARAWFDRSRPHLLLAGVLTLTAIVQLAVLLSHASARPFEVRPGVFATAALTQTVWSSLLEIGLTRKVLSLGAASGAFQPVWLLLTITGLALVAVAVRAARAGGAAWLPLVILLGSWAGVTTLNLFGSLSDVGPMVVPDSGTRYFACGMLCWMVLLALATRYVRVRRIATALILWIAVAAGAQRAFGGFARQFGQGPDWRREVAACRARPAGDCTLRIWPDAPRDTGGIWAVRLPREAVAR